MSWKMLNCRLSRELLRLMRKLKKLKIWKNKSKNIDIYDYI